MVKVLFTYYPFSVRYNHGVALLSSICKKNNIESRILPMQKKWHYLAEITDYNPDYVCVSIVTKYDYHEAVTVSKYIKERGFKIIVGGVYPRGGAEMDGVFDYVCRGEAEQGLVNFLKNRDISVFKIPERCKDISTLPELVSEVLKNREEYALNGFNFVAF